ncbi:MAG: hypothetical protein JWM69_1151 [Candidatus Binatus sp.]|nr:hypothetical protein [Candidatus Binatus sp.]
MKARGAVRLCLLLIASVAAACSCTRSSPNTAAVSANHPNSNEIKVQIASVGVDQTSGAHFVLLQDDSETRDLPIMIGDNEAQSILLALHGIKAPRPLTHDLLKSVIEQTGNRVDRILIADEHDEVYYAKIYLDHGRVSIDSRPSDAIALAMNANAPIYVNAKLFETSNPPAAKPSKPGNLPQTIHALGMTVQQITPDLAQYFGNSSARGVLVSQVDPVAKKAGVARGDIVVKVGNQNVNAMEDFVRIASDAKTGAVMLTVDRDGASRTITMQNHPGEMPRH